MNDRSFWLVCSLALCSRMDGQIGGQASSCQQGPRAQLLQLSGRQQEGTVVPAQTPAMPGGANSVNTLNPFFVLDRITGENLLTASFGPVNWTLGVDKQGRPIPNPSKEPAPDGRLIAPDEGGMTNYRSPSFDPKTGLFIVDAHPSYGIYFAKPADGNFGWAGADYDVWGKGVLEAIDYQTGKVRWSHELGPNGSGAGVLTTASGLIFTGDALGNVMALSTAEGATLWHAGEGAPMQSSPISYALDGRQYVITSAGGVMFAWALPENR